MQNRLRCCAALIAIVLMTASCEENPTSTTPTPTKGATNFAFITTTDFETGSASVIWLDGSYTTQKNVATIHSDAVARFYNSYIYVVNRLGADNIQILDPANGFSTVRQFSVGNGSDPHDIVVVNSTKAYVTRYNKTDLWIVDPSTGTQTGSINLSALADADGIPEMDQLALVGNYLFVTIQRLDRNNNFTPVGASFVAVVDVAADTLLDVESSTGGTQPIVLTASNPFSDVEIHPTTGNLVVACVGSFGVQDGGVNIVNVRTLASDGLMLTESTAGGDITDVEILKDNVGYVLITDAGFNTLLLSFNPQSGTILDTVYAPGGFVLNDAELSPAGELFLTDRSATNPGIRIYETETLMEIVTMPIDVGLPPLDITFGTTKP